MSLVSLADALQYLGVASQYFTITADNDALIFTSSSGGPVTIDVTDGTYEGAALATLMTTLMNANTTLTGTGTITFAVTYSSTTGKFTIDAGTGKTIAYTHTGSDGGLTFGFNQAHSAAQTITSDLAAGDPSEDVEDIVNWVDKQVKRSCRRDFEETTYAEWYDGEPYNDFYLPEYPITEFYRMCLGARDAVLISNSATCAYATASVSLTGLTLLVVGGSDAGTDSLLFADYTTLTTLVAAINAAGNGWTASLVDSDFGIYPSTELKPDKGISCDDTGYLRMPETPETDLEIDETTGRVTKAGTWGKARNGIFAHYKGGFSTLPADLVEAVKTIIGFYYQKKIDGTFGLSVYDTGGVRATFEAEIPESARNVLDSYRRPLF